MLDSDNPVAAALLAKMGYNRKERKAVRTAYLRMMLRLNKIENEAKMALIASVADLYFQPDPAEDGAILRELRELDPEGGEALMELMPAWKRWGYEEGMEKGMEKGREMERRSIAFKLLDKGLTMDEVAETLGMSPDEIRRLRQPGDSR